MIIIEICSGLGNQMFRYAFARSRQLDWQDKLFFSTQLFKKEERTYSLDKLNISQPDGFLSDRSMKLYTSLYATIRRIKGYSLYNEEECLQFYKKTGFYKTALRKYISIPKTHHKCVYFNANFQCETYFKRYEDILRTELKVRVSPTIQNAKMIDRIKSCNSVCLHIRRGDYLYKENKATFAVCSTQYYSNAIEYIKGILKSPVFFVFSENIEWVKAQNFKGEMVYVDFNNPDYEELRLMYNCKHFIISNSTFSWWAQYLSDNSEKIVVAPSKWTNDENENKNSLYMDNWHILY